MLQNPEFEQPVYSISMAAHLLSISVHTIRMYEREGLIIPHKKESNQRLYSKADLERIQCIRRSINESKISINGIKRIYSLIPCWEIVKCSDEDKSKCEAYKGHEQPCWTYQNKSTKCEDLKCRSCDVYYKYSQCSEVKDLIKSISR